MSNSLKHIRLPIKDAIIAESILQIRNDIVKQRFGDLHLHITPNFIESFSRLVKLKSGTLSQYIKCADILPKLQLESPNRLIWIYCDISDNTVLSIVDGEAIPLPKFVTQKLIGELTRKIDLSGVSADRYGVSFDAMREETISTCGLSYNLGFRAWINHAGDKLPSIHALLRISDHHAHIPIRAARTTIDIPHQEDMEQLINRVGNDFYYLVNGAPPIKIEEFIKEKINNAVQTPVSLQEIGSFIKELRSHAGNEVASSVINDLNLYKVLDDFDMASFNDNSSQWRRIRGARINRLSIFKLAIKYEMISYAEKWILRPGDLAGFTLANE